MLHNLCEIIFKYYIASSATTSRTEAEAAAAEAEAVAASANLSTLPTDAIRGEKKQHSSTRYQHNVLTATVFIYMYVFVGVPLSVFVCSTFQVLPPRKRVNCARGWVYAAVKLRFTCELNLSAVIFRQVFRITE